MKLNIIFYAILLLSCSNSNNINIESKDPKDIEHINLTNIKNVPDISFLNDYISDVKLIKLETNDNSFIQRIDDIIITNDRIFVLDLMNPISQIKVFDKKGKWINSATNGGGPGEIVKAYSFAYDYQKNELIVVQNGWLSFFDKDLHHLRDMQNPYAFNSIVEYNGYYILKALKHHTNSFLGKNSNNRIMIIDKDFNLKHVALPIYRDIVVSFHPFFVCNDGVSITETNCDTIYKYVENKISPKYVFNYPDKTFKDKISLPEGQFALNKLKGYTFHGVYFENDKCLQIHFENVNDGQKIIATYNKKSKHIISGIITFDYWMNNYPVFATAIANTTDGYFVSEINVDNKDCQIKQVASFLSEEDKKIAKNMKEDDNSILVLFKFKDF